MDSLKADHVSLQHIRYTELPNLQTVSLVNLSQKKQFQRYFSEIGGDYACKGQGHFGSYPRLPSFLVSHNGRPSYFRL